MHTLHGLAVGVFYLGTFVVLGLAAKRVLDLWMDDKGLDPSDLEKQRGQAPSTRFLLGAWRHEDPL